MLPYNFRDYLSMSVQRPMSKKPRCTVLNMIYCNDVTKHFQIGHIICDVTGCIYIPSVHAKFTVLAEFVLYPT